MKVIKAYFDNNIVCGMIRGDLEKSDPKRTEMNAVRDIQTAADRGLVSIVTSREAWREQDRTRSVDLRSQLESKRGNVPVVQDDHRMLGGRALYDNQGNWYGNSPILTEVVDDALLAAARAAGLADDADARHFMYAVHNGCHRFLTTDPHFNNRRLQLEAHGRGMLVRRPSELVAELQAIEQARAAAT